jgi:hypothetical protein
MISFYTLVLIIHVLAVFALSAVLSIETLSLVRLRAASTYYEVSTWINAASGLRFFAAGSVLVILFSGAHLVAEESAFAQAWPKVAMAGIFLLASLGAVNGRRMRTLRKDFNVAKAMNPELLRRLRDPFLKISLDIRIAVFLGIFLVVSAKPGLWGSISLVGGCAVLGLLSSLLTSRRNPTLPLPTADLGD